MGENAFSIQPFEVRRVRVQSTRSFEEVRLYFQQVVGKTTIPQGSPKAQGAVSTREQFEQAIQQEVGESDFTLMVAMDYGHWLPLFGIQRKVMRWIVGKPLIAITMIRSQSVPIYKGVMDEVRCRAVSQTVTGCAAHASRRVLTRHLKTYSLVTLFTTKIVAHSRYLPASTLFQEPKRKDMRHFPVRSSRRMRK